MAPMIVGDKATPSASHSTLTHGIALGTQVLTLEGEMPIEFLTPGDRILTRSGARRLRSIKVCSVRNGRVIRITAGSLGVDRPGGDMIVSPDQPILIRDWRAKALFGSATAMVPAARLADGEYIRAEVVEDMRFYTLHLDTAEVIYAGGLELACTPETVSA